MLQPRLYTFLIFMCLSSSLLAQTPAKKAEDFYLKAYKNYQQSKFDSAITNFRKASVIYDSLKNSQGLVYCQNGMAMSFLFLFEHDSARLSLQKALQKSDSAYYDGITYNNLSKVYNEEGDLQMERAYLQKALAAFKSSIGKENDMVALIIANIANSYHHQGDYKMAVQYHQKALQLRKKVIKKDIHDSFAQSYWLLGVAYRYLEQNNRALSLLNKALDMWKKLYGEENEPVARVYFDMALCHHSLNNEKKELALLQKSLSIRKSIYNTYSRHLAEAYEMIGNYFYRKGDVYHALTNYKHALHSIGIATDSQLGFGSIKIEDEDIQAKPVLLDIMNSLGEVLITAYRNDQKLEQLEAAKHIYTIAVNVIQQQRGKLVSIEAKRALAKNRRSLFEGAIHTSLLFYNITGKKKYIDKAFTFSEKSKAYILHERLSESGAEEFGNIPPQMLAIEKKNGLKLAKLQKQVLKAKQQQDSAKTARLSKHFNDQKLAYDSIIKAFEKKYPSYYQLKYSNKTLSLDEIRRTVLTDESELLEYFIGDSIIYTFRLSQHDITCNQIKKDFDLSSWVSMMRQGVYGYHFTPETKRTDSLYVACNRLYIRYASKLYQKLVEPIINSKTNRLIIIPDGEINFIPFGALLTSVPDNEESFRNYPFFIKKQSVSYLYSASLNLRQDRNQSDHKKPKLIAFAPDFSNQKRSYETIDTYRRGNLGPLKYNKQEVATVAGIMGGDLYTGEEANLNKFMNSANNYDIIHIASHAKANNNTPELSFVAFHSTKKGNDPNLYLADIYNMTLNAEMVVLSACETGFGKLYGSEGVASLAQGFAYAGAKSLLTTLWSVDDKATSSIMSSFYKELSEGSTKDAALYHSKLDYLNANITDEELHPYYWSGIIMIGNAKSLVKDSLALPFYGILALAVFGLFIIIFMIRKRKTA